MIHLAVGTPVDDNPIRNDDYAECLSRNILNPNILTVTVVQEECELPQTDRRRCILDNAKVRVVKLGRRATFSDYFKIMSSLCTKDVKGFANADVYFDFSLCQLRGLNLGSRVLAITRSDHLPYSVAGQDAWMFSGSVDIDAEFPLGYDWCDFKLLEVLERSGHPVLNPAHSIRLVHMHRWRRTRTENEKVHSGVFPRKINCCEIHNGAITRVWTVTY